MAAPTIEQIMLGIEARLKTIDGLRTSATSPDEISPPCAVVGVPAIDDYHATMARGRMVLYPTVAVLVDAQYSRTGQLRLAGYANPTGATSVVTAIEGDKTLGGVVEDCIVRSFDPEGLEEVGLIGYFGGLFRLQVTALGS